MPTERPLSPTAGALALLEGFRLGLGTPRLRRRLLGSFAVNALGFLLLAALMLWGAFALVDWLVSSPEPADPGWLMATWLWIRGALGVALRIAAVLGTAVIAPVLYNLVSSLLFPLFSGPVFNAARDAAHGPPVLGAPDGFVATAKVIAVETRRLGRFAGYSLALLPLNLVPGLGSAAYVALQFLLSARTLGWDLLSYHFELHGLTFDEQKRWISSHHLLVLTLGGVATLLCIVPVVQLVFVTTNVAGAGVLSAWLDGAPRGQITARHGAGGAGG
ncbi:MAG: EI24 domain-containing protein [Myxococcota bacterium]